MDPEIFASFGNTGHQVSLCYTISSPGAERLEQNSTTIEPISQNIIGHQRHFTGCQMHRMNGATDPSKECPHPGSHSTVRIQRENIEAYVCLMDKAARNTDRGSLVSSHERQDERDQAVSYEEAISNFMDSIWNIRVSGFQVEFESILRKLSEMQAHIDKRYQQLLRNLQCGSFATASTLKYDESAITNTPPLEIPKETYKGNSEKRWAGQMYESNETDTHGAVGPLLTEVVRTPITSNTVYKFRPCHIFGMIAILGIVLSASVATWYSLTYSDVSGGFAIGSYIVAVMTMVITIPGYQHSRSCTCWVGGTGISGGSNV
ncbi:hypothetical protein SUNI508_10544 [Seiridium unicorne]|uniref:Uncharacterized protein n=1 Tax=Seiridium unicorne TaxID=138068 RepID=A0ABR2UL45_9PEZI